MLQGPSSRSTSTSGTYCPHGVALWEPPVGQVTPHSTGINLLINRLNLHGEPEKVQQRVLDIIIVLLLFRTPLPSKDDAHRTLDEYRPCFMTENIATVIRANNAGITCYSNEGDTWDAVKGPGAQARDVQQAYEYLKSHPMERRNPFYRWQQVHRIAQNGEPQCRECWAEKENIERKFFHGLGDIALFDDSD